MSPIPQEPEPFERQLRVAFRGADLPAAPRRLRTDVESLLSRPRPGAGFAGLTRLGLGRRFAMGTLVAAAVAIAIVAAGLPLFHVPSPSPAASQPTATASGPTASASGPAPSASRPAACASEPGLSANPIVPGSSVSPSPSPRGAAGPAGVFRQTGSMGVPRANATATLLSSGRVLIAGGTDGGNVGNYSTARTLDSAELYDPATGKFSPAGSMATTRFSQTATLLPNGCVLIAGGYDGANALASAELYDPATGKFSPTGSMTTRRGNQTATLLPDGRVLVAGGYDGPIAGYGPTGWLASAELYDPSTGRFSSTGSMTTARDGQTATLLPDGRVLVAGGYDGTDNLASAELYDPATGKFGPAGSMAAARASHTATLLSDGRVLLVGGLDGTATAELYDPATGRFSPTGSMAADRFSQTATLLPDGRVLVVGGLKPEPDKYWYVASAEMYDPVSGKFGPAGSMASTRAYHTATLLPSGQILLAGGENDGDNVKEDAPLLTQSSAELFGR